MPSSRVPGLSQDVCFKRGSRTLTLERRRGLLTLQGDGRETELVKRRLQRATREDVKVWGSSNGA